MELKWLLISATDGKSKVFAIADGKKRFAEIRTTKAMTLEELLRLIALARS